MKSSSYRVPVLPIAPITAVLFVVAVFLFRKGLKYTGTRTKFRFEVVKVFENGGHFSYSRISLILPISSLYSSSTTL